MKSFVQFLVKPYQKTFVQLVNKSRTRALRNVVCSFRVPFNQLRSDHIVIARAYSRAHSRIDLFMDLLFVSVSKNEY